MEEVRRCQLDRVGGGGVYVLLLRVFFPLGDGIDAWLPPQLLYSIDRQDDPNDGFETRNVLGATEGSDCTYDGCCRPTAGRVLQDDRGWFVIGEHLNRRVHRRCESNDGN